MRIFILKSFLVLVNNLMASILTWRTAIIDLITDLTNQQVMLFTRGGRLYRLHQAFEYILKNEASRRVVLVHLHNSPEQNEESQIREGLEFFREIFPEIAVDLVVREGRFSPEMIDNLSREFKIPKNNIFIGAPEQKHSFSIEDLGGVRVIF